MKSLVRLQNLPVSHAHWPHLHHHLHRRHSYNVLLPYAWMGGTRRMSVHHVGHCANLATTVQAVNGSHVQRVDI